MESMLERERKLTAPRDFAGAAVGGEQLPDLTLRSTYFDTADYSLTHAGVT